MKFRLLALMLLSYPLFFGAGTPDAEAILKQAIQRQIALPRYAEAFYSPLRRAPVVDAVLDDPYYLPVYALDVSHVLSSSANLETLFSEMLISSAILSVEGAKAIQFRETPELFLQTFGMRSGKALDSFWQDFMCIYRESEKLLSVLSESEKQWIREHKDAFFFGEKQDQEEYDFFTTNSTMPLKFFEMAARLDLAQLADLARQLCAIVDQVYMLKSELYLPEDFIWEENGLKLIITNKNHAQHTESADFFIGLGSHNVYQNNAGGTEGKRAAALSAISLHFKEAIPVLLDTLQFKTLDTEENYGDNLYNELSNLVGVDLGLDREAWVQWWEKVKDSFEFPTQLKQNVPCQMDIL